MAMLYNIFFILFAIAYLPYLVIKGKAHKDFRQRFGILPDNFKRIGKERPIWVHTVSVGEVLASRQFVDLLSRQCKKPIVISTTTKTGNDLARDIFGEDILKFYFPLDLSFIVKKVLNILNPSIFVIFETEIWPNLITETSKRNIPIALLNGRISDSSYGGYRRIRFLLKEVLKRIDTFCMQTDLDKERIVDIGAPRDRVKVMGNMKFDMLADSKALPEAISGKLGIKKNERLLVAGSTHRGEDEVILDVYKELTKEFPGLRLLIAPRHVERTEEIENLIKGKELPSMRVSGIQHDAQRNTQYASRNTHHASRNTQYASRNTILILDTIGELKKIFSAAAIVFMGGSLVKKGGHNIVEPALFSRPIVFGPDMSNFRDMARIFLENKASVQIRDRDSLKQALLDLLKNEDKAACLGQNAGSLVERHKGATKRNLDEVLGKIQGIPH